MAWETCQAPKKFLTLGQGCGSLAAVTAGDPTRQGRSPDFRAAFVLQIPHAAFSLQLPHAVQQNCYEKANERLST